MVLKEKENKENKVFIAGPSTGPLKSNGPYGPEKLCLFYKPPQDMGVFE